MEELSAAYWSDRYKNENAPWDIRNISTPIKEYIDQLTDKSISILIPGCGFGYEGEYLFRQGFTNVYLLDFAKEPIEAFAKRNPNFPEDHLLVDDFFGHQQTYDLIFEQTLFCAIDPSLRQKYAFKAAELLKPNGKLVGLLFNRDFEGGPPFGGNKEEYMTYFKPYFTTVKMVECYNSILPRRGNELFVQMKK